jgi:hypothetical protein
MVETPESLERVAEEFVRLANEDARDLTVAGDLVDLAEKYMKRANELRALRSDIPERSVPARPDGAAPLETSSRGMASVAESIAAKGPGWPRA